MTRVFLALALALGCQAAEPAAVASGRNWQVAIGGIACEGGGSFVVIGARIRYLGPKGLVETPVSELIDGAGRRHRPRSLVWKSGSREHAEWLSSKGMASIESGDIGEFQLKFDVRDATGGLRLEFGDIGEILLTRKAGSVDAGLCDALLPLERIQAPRSPRSAAGERAKTAARVYRGAYPCAAQKGSLRTIEARYPPYPPRQLLVFGRGYLPNARRIELPMGWAPAQPYAYTGLDDLNAVEAAARRALLADFPEHRSDRLFAFNWGSQTAPSGNMMYSIGLYEVRPCPK